MRNYILNADGEPVPEHDIIAWARWFEKSTDLRIVAKTQVGDASVSTMFLGIDHSFGDGPPLLYETMIFGGPHNEYQERYSTRAEAMEGHTRAVKLALGETP